jgi:predicted DNA-binding transcriptional regulator AlpA
MNKQNQLPETGFLRLPQVLQFIPISKTSFYDGIKAGVYPKQVKLSERTSAWRVEDIRKLIKELGGEA